MESKFLIQDSERKAFGERLESLIPDRKRTEFAKNTGIAESTLRSLVKGASFPRLDTLVAIANEAGVTVEWLATGRGSKHYRDVENSFNNKDSSYSPFAKSIWDEPLCSEFDFINLYNAQVSMGSGSWNDSEHVVSKLAFRNDWLKQESLAAEQCAAILANGDSMEETIKDGSTLLVNLADTEISRDGIYVIMFDGHLLAKRLQRSFDGSVIIKSDNKAYSEISVPKNRIDELRIVGRVVWFGNTI